MFGQTVTFTATVTPVIAGPIPSGFVTFYDGPMDPAHSIGTANLTGSGVATFTTSKLDHGGSPHTINVQYSGNGTYGPNSTSVLQTVDLANTNIGTGNPTPAAVAVGATVTFTATVTAQTAGIGTPTGTVTFYDGVITPGNSIGDATLNAGGVATFVTSSLTGGTHSISLAYNGDINFGTTTKTAAITQTVNKIGTSTTLSSSGGPTSFGQTITFTSTVHPLNATSLTPGGFVTFHDGSLTGTSLGTATLDASGVATFTDANLSVGNHTIFAVYSGDTNFTTSNAPNSVPQVVGKAVPTVVVASSLPSSNAGDFVTFTANISSGSGTPTGTVTFTRQRTGGAVVKLKVVKLTALSGGLVTFTTRTLPPGTYTISAKYTPDAASALKFNPSTPASTTPALQTVTDFVSALKAVATPSVPGPGSVFTLSVTAIDPLNLTVTSDTNFVTATQTGFADPLGHDTGGQITGLGTLQLVGGHIVFTGLRADKVGTYTVRIDSAGVVTQIQIVVSGSGRQK
jgi:hypothetical protein